MTNLKKELKTMLKAMAAAAAATFLLGAVSTYSYSNKIQEGIAKEVVRFHVLANSNSSADQSIKLNVRDSVLEAIKPYMENCSGKEEALALLSALRPVMKNAADSSLLAQGAGYTAKVKIESCFFPVKNYGGAVFPAGVYDAVRIELGEGRGKNWWCVMYPSMCFVEEGMETGQEEKLVNILTEEEYSVITGEDETAEIKFKIAELWHKIEFELGFAQSGTTKMLKNGGEP